MLVELRLQPRLELRHHRPAVRLMPRQAFSRRELPVPRLRIVMIDLAERFEDVPALLRKIRRDVHYVPLRVRHIWRSGYGTVSGAWNYPELMQQAAVNNR